MAWKDDMITQRNMSISIKICRQGNCCQSVISVVTVLDCPILHDPLKINISVIECHKPIMQQTSDTANSSKGIPNPHR